MFVYRTKDFAVVGCLEDCVELKWVRGEWWFLHPCQERGMLDIEDDCPSVPWLTRESRCIPATFLLKRKSGVTTLGWHLPMLQSPSESS